MSEILTTVEAARVLKVSPRQIATWFDAGKLRGWRIPGSTAIRIPRRYLDEFVMKHGLPKPDEPAKPQPSLLEKYNRLRRVAKAAVIAFGSDTEAQAIQDLGNLLAEGD